LFSWFSTQRDLAPEGGKLADAVFAAVRAQRESPEQLAALVKDLGSPDDQTRGRAVTGLTKAGTATVGPLVAVLADPARSGQHAIARWALAELGPDAVEPLVAWLDSPDPKLVAQLAPVLADAGGRDVAPALLAPCLSSESDPAVQAAARAALGRLVGVVPSAAEAAAMLARQSRQKFDSLTTMAPNDAKTTVWRLDAAQGKAVAKSYPADTARAILAARLARDALVVAPGDADVRRLFAMTTLEAAALEAGLDDPLPQEPGTPAARAAEFDAKELLAALDEALTTGHGPAAAAIARILGGSATARTALAVGASPTALVRALRAGDRRTRAAAVEAVVRLGPKEPFPGSSYLGEAMAFLAGSTGERRAMVAASNTDEARRVAGYLVALGYEAETAVTGREMIAKLIESPDYELVFIDARLEGGALGILLAQLRHDGRTASLPVGILAAEGYYDKAQRVARGDRLAVAMVRPHDQATVQSQVEALQALAGRSMVPAELRRRQAAQTLAWLAQLSDTSRRLLDLQTVEHAVLGAVWSPATSADAIVMLQRLATPESQKTLVDLASDSRQPLALRKSALAALTTSVERDGILLTTDEILAQYDRYNQSATADGPTQETLGLVLDCLEAAGSRQPTAGSEERGKTR
jgi:hypothetical protein